MIDTQASREMIQVQLDLSNITQYTNGTQPLSVENLERAMVLLVRTWDKLRTIEQKEAVHE